MNLDSRELAATPGKWLSPPLAAYLVSRGLLLLVGYVGLTFWPLVKPDAWQAFPNQLWLDGWARFDSGWYWTVIERGYYYEAGLQSNVSFLPLYPWLSLVFSFPLRLFLPNAQAFYLSGMLLSQLAFFIALVGLHRLAVLRLDRKSADLAPWLLCLYPFSLFFGAVYAESLYLALAVWSFYWAERRQWGMACFLAGLCAVTYIPGWLVGLGIALLYAEQRNFRFRGIDGQAYAFALVPLGLFPLLGFFFGKTGDPLLLIRTLAPVWKAEAGPSSSVATALEAVVLGTGWDLRLLYACYLLLFLAAVLLGCLAWKRLGAGYCVFTLASCAMSAVAGVDGMGRYVAVLFPVFLVGAALLRGRVAIVAVCLTFATLLTLFTFFFTHWHLVT